MFAACTGDEHLAVKLGRATRRARRGARAAGRPAVGARAAASALFYDWVALPPEQEDQWMRFAEVARLRGQRLSAHPLLAGLDRDRQHVLGGRDRAGGELRQAARQVARAVEVERDRAVVGSGPSPSVRDAG